MQCWLCPFYHSGYAWNRCDLTESEYFKEPEECSILDDDLKFKEDNPEFGFVKGDKALKFYNYGEKSISESYKYDLGLETKKYKRLIRNCYYCKNRHWCQYDFDEMFGLQNGELTKKECKHWHIGKCLFCKYIDDTDDNWFKRGCEIECFGGCKKFKRNWNKTFRWILHKEFIDDTQVYKL